MIGTNKQKKMMSYSDSIHREDELTSLQPKLATEYRSENNSLSGKLLIDYSTQDSK